MKALLAIDGSTESALALETAAGLSWPAGSRLEVLTVLPTVAEWYGDPWAVGMASTPPDDIRDRMRVDGEALLERAAGRLRQSGVDVGTYLVEGRAASVIVDIAREIGADLIVLGARGHGTIEKAVLGSVSAEVVDQAPCAVLVARQPSTKRILIATDGSDAATMAAAFVGTSGLFAASRARVVHALDVHPAWWLGFTPGDATFAVDAYVTVVEEGHQRGDEMTSGVVARLRADGLDASAVTREGNAPAEILAEAADWHADLVVVGTRGNGLLKRLLLGSTARTILHYADASVLITRPTSVVVREGVGAVAEPADTVRA